MSGGEDRRTDLVVGMPVSERCKAPVAAKSPACVEYVANTSVCDGLADEHRSSQVLHPETHWVGSTSLG
jgi:hypothetical protein